MFFELRQYHIHPGQRDKWVKCMEEEIIPFQVKMGMVILGSFVGEEDESVYVWIRRFESEAERKRLYDQKSTRLNSSHVSISYAVFCLKKKKKHTQTSIANMINNIVTAHA